MVFARHGKEGSMLSAFTSANRHALLREFVWFVVFTFTLSCMPHLEFLIPYRLRFSLAPAYAEEPPGEAPVATSSEEAPPAEEPPAPVSEAAGAAALAGDTDAMEQLIPAVSFKVDDFTGAAHMSYPIIVPPGRNGLAPNLSLDYSSSGGNGWIGVGWDLGGVGSIQRRGPRKGVPSYNDTIDVFELQIGNGVPLELVYTSSGPATRQYRLKIEGAYLNITYYVQENYWIVLDKSGLKMRFGYGQGDITRIVKAAPYGSGTYRWCLDRVEDPKTDYMEFQYQKFTDNPGQIYLQQISYNGEVAGGLSHNHVITFSLEGSRTDPIYNYRGGFRSLTKK